jgi:hypothetical protein
MPRGGAIVIKEPDHGDVLEIHSLLYPFRFQREIEQGGGEAGSF